jgi:hypothetical protein
MPIVAGMDQHAVEKKVLRYIDNAAAGVRAKLENGGLQSLTPQDRTDWVLFLMSLRIRQPSLVQMLRDGSADHLRKTLAEQPEQYAEIAGEEDVPTLEKWTEKTFPGLIDNFGLTFFHELVDNPEIGTKLLKLNWWLWDFSDGHSLLLSDHPCVFTGGIDSDNLLVALPISPHKAFFATRGERVATLMRRQTQKSLSAALNESSLGQATNKMYAVNRSCERFITNRAQPRNSL